MNQLAFFLVVLLSWTVIRVIINEWFEILCNFFLSVVVMLAILGKIKLSLYEI